MWESRRLFQVSVVIRAFQRITTETAFSIGRNEHTVETGLCVCPLPYSPDKSCQFPRYGNYRLIRRFPSIYHPAIFLIQSRIRLLCHANHFHRLPGASCFDSVTCRRPMSIMPRGFHQYPAHMHVARPGYATATDAIAGTVFARYKSNC